MRHITVICAIAALAATLGCDPEYGELELTLMSDPPRSIVARGDGVVIPAGFAVMFEAEPTSRTREGYEKYDLDLVSQDEAVFAADPGVTEGSFVLIGIAPGTTCMDVILDDRTEECLPVRVIDPVLSD